MFSFVWQQHWQICDWMALLPCMIAVTIWLVFMPIWLPMLHICMPRLFMAACTASEEVFNAVARLWMSYPLRCTACMITAVFASFCTKGTTPPCPLPIIPPRAPPKPPMPPHPIRMNRSRMANRSSPQPLPLRLLPFPISARMFGSTPRCCISAGSMARMPLVPPPEFPFSGNTKVLDSLIVVFVFCSSGH